MSLWIVTAMQVTNKVSIRIVFKGFRDEKLHSLLFLFQLLCVYKLDDVTQLGKNIQYSLKGA